MSYPTTNSQEKADFFHSSGPACGNCGRQGCSLTYIEDGDWMACDECAEEQERIEFIARELRAVISSCDERAGIIDDSRTCGELVNRLKAHEQTQCAACASTRKTVQEDRQYVNSTAVCCEGEAA